jgi:hypothetical protein
MWYLSKIQNETGDFILECDLNSEPISRQINLLQTNLATLSKVAFSSVAGGMISYLELWDSKTLRVKSSIKYKIK